MKKKQVAVNAFMAVMQTIVTGIVLLFLYRHLLHTIGIEQLGIWSLILSSTSLTKIADLGLSGSAVKFVARYAAQDDLAKVSKVIQTTLIAMGAISGIILLALYPFAPKILMLLLPPSSLGTAVTVLPYAFLSVWLSVLCMVFLSAIDGLQRVDIRSTITIVGSLFQLIVSLLLVDKLGLIGLGISQLVQYAVLMGLSFLILRKYAHLPLAPLRWDQALFQEMLGYGTHFQIISISRMMYDPITKGLIAHFGGLSLLGFYEMASRLVLQVRSLIVVANQALVPTLAGLHERDPSRLDQLYATSVRLVFFVDVPLFTALAISSPVVSSVWIGYIEPTFVYATCLLSVGWAINTLSGPAYFASLGTGDLRRNTLSHIAIGILNFACGFVLGTWGGGKGVIMGWVIALIVGSAMLIISYGGGIKKSIKLYTGKESLHLILGVTVSVIVLLVILPYMGKFYWWIQMGFVSLVFFVSLVPSIWLHPARHYVQEYIAMRVRYFI